MEIRDPIHGSIKIDDEESIVIEHPFFQRLRNIKQLGFSDYIFPGATHTRYLHSIGVMHTTSLVFDKLFAGKLENKEIQRLKKTVKLAGLLHDIGHAPLSHTTEAVMPKVSELGLPDRFKPTKSDRQATHEDYTLKAITDSFFTESFESIRKKFGVDYNAVAELILGKTSNDGYFIHEGVNYFPVLHQMISSEMDCDRMDYLLRDSYYCGVSYGNYDLDWIIDNLEIANVKECAYLAISERALTTFDDFLLSRFHMFIMVYFHYRAVCLEKMMYRYFDQCQTEYVIPAKIDEYLEHDDHHLLKILRASDNTWAQRIVKNQIPPKIFEAFGSSDIDKQDALLNFFKKNNIDFILCESRGRLSKYYSSSNTINDDFQMMVKKQYGKGHMTISEATDLFSKYSSAHSVSRIHCFLDDIDQALTNKIHDIIEQ